MGKRLGRKERSLFSGLLEALVGNIDSIEELSVILVTDLGALGDLGASDGNVLVVNSFDDNLVLESLTELDAASGHHHGLEDLLSTKEILDLDERSVFGDDGVNREMSVNTSHLISEALFIIIINKLVDRLTSVTPSNMFLIKEMTVPTEQDCLE